MCDWGRNYHIERNVSEQRGTTMTEPVDSDVSPWDEDDNPEALAGEELTEDELEAVFEEEGE